MQTDVHECLQLFKNVEITSGETWTLGKKLKHFPAKSLKSIANQVGSVWADIVWKKDATIQ